MAYKTGYTVTQYDADKDEFQTVDAATVPQPYSAKLAEIKALTI